MLNLRVSDLAGMIDTLSAAGIAVERRGRLLELPAVEGDLPGQGLGRGQGGQHEAEPVAGRVAERAVGGPGH